LGGQRIGDDGGPRPRRAPYFLGQKRKTQSEEGGQGTERRQDALERQEKHETTACGKLGKPVVDV
jgi:hypothetical protein